MYSLPTFSSSSWSLSTFSKIFMIGLPIMILCERFSGRSKT
jgi:Na+-driven multidrug efflux pump